jgi:hypothetical protein
MERLDGTPGSYEANEGFGFTRSAGFLPMRNDVINDSRGHRWRGARRVVMLLIRRRLIQC